jgi:TolB-like protein/DNA-binding winged helix-turn-helix (wHTH) protein/Tfp pilus assembly protein PilF
MIELSESTIYEFGDFRLDGKSHRLFRRETKELVPLTPKAVEVLLVFAQSGGEMLTKDELLDKVWGGAFVEESNLAQTIFVLRKTLGDDTKEPKYILTVPHRGYQFISTVNQRHADDDILEESLLSETERLASIEPQKSKVRLTLFALAPIVLVLGFAAYWFFPTTKVAKAPEIRTIAILPFEDLSEQQTEKYLGISIADALAKQFGSLKQITARPIQAVLKYTDRRSDHQTIGRELQVDAILEGRIQRNGDRLRVNAHLIRISDNSTVWTDSFDDEFTNFFAVQDSISSKVVTSLALKMDDSERRRFEQRGTTSVEAYQAYMRGRYFWNKRTGENLQKAIAEFERSVAHDPQFALAFAGLADCHQLTSEYFLATPKDAFAKARTAAQRALEIDPNLAEAHTSLAYTKAFYDWDWTGADASFKRALEINPNYSIAHQWYGEYLTAMGKLDEARLHHERALQLDPASPILMTEIVSLLHIQKKYDELIEGSKRIIEIDPNFAYAYFYLAIGYEGKGMQAEMVDSQIRMFTLFGEPAEVTNEIRTAFDRDGVRGFWQKRLEQIETRPHLKYFPSFTKALVHVRVGDHDGSLRSLYKSYEMREHNLVYAKYVPDLEPLREDPRFKALVSKIGL